ncbi:MAG: hypothetical protein ACOVOD_11570, partial [Rhodoferax sp.]
APANSAGVVSRLSTPESLFFERSGMWKIIVGFALFAGLGLYVLSTGGDIDMGGEKHGADAMHTEAPAAAPASVASAAKP